MNDNPKNISKSRVGRAIDFLDQYTGRAYASVFVATALLGGGKFINQFAPAAAPQSDAPMTIAVFPDQGHSFQEYVGNKFGLDRDSRKTAEWAVSNQKMLSDNKAELDGVIASCVQVPTNCSPHVLAFKTMLDQASKIQEPHKRAAAVNGWVNTAITYDYDESGLDKTGTRFISHGKPHRTMLQTVNDGMGVCDEQAQLKLYALDKVGFSEKDIRYMGQIQEANGQENMRHAYVLVRIDKTIWALNNQQIDTPAGQQINMADARKIVSHNSAFHSADTELWVSPALPYMTANFSSSAVVSAVKDSKQNLLHKQLVHDVEALHEGRDPSLEGALSAPGFFIVRDGQRQDKEIANVVMPAVEAKYGTILPEPPSEHISANHSALKTSATSDRPDRNNPRSKPKNSPSL